MAEDTSLVVVVVAVMMVMVAATHLVVHNLGSSSSLDLVASRLGNSLGILDSLVATLIAVMVVAVAVHILVDNLGSSCLDTLDSMVVLVATHMWVAVLVTAVLAADATLMVVDTHSLVAIRHMVVC